MIDVTLRLNRYREAARSLWNNYFFEDPALQNWEAFDSFELIRRTLFDALVLIPLDVSWPLNDIFRQPIPQLVVEPSSQEIPIMINKPRSYGSGYYDDPVNRIGPNDAKLCFQDFFDWSQKHFVDYHYFRVRIVEFPKQPHLVNREALVEVLHARVFLAADDADRLGSI